MRKVCPSVVWVAAAVLLSFTMLCSAAVAAADKRDYLRPAEVPVPANNAMTPARIELGRALFFDPRLSDSNWISCATCHHPGLGWSDGLPTGVGHNMQILSRATPTILNSAYNQFQFWDGRARTLEEQALGPIQAAGEMNQNISGLIAELRNISGYKAMFEAAYPGEGISKETIGKAIASFERTVVSSESPFDRWIKGDEKAISEAAKRGFELFEGKARCSICHSGFNFSDNGFHNIGITQKGEPDLGRYALRKVRVLRGAFKTPTLRDVALTAPYMHNGVYATLEEVVEHYDRGGDVKKDLSANIMPLHLSSQEKEDLVAFMKSLTGDPVEVAIPRLPIK
jgi:cytochrome c peroxidase